MGFDSGVPVAEWNPTRFPLSLKGAPGSWGLLAVRQISVLNSWEMLDVCRKPLLSPR